MPKIAGRQVEKCTLRGAAMQKTVKTPSPSGGVICRAVRDGPRKNAWGCTGI